MDALEAVSRRFHQLRVGDFELEYQSSYVFRGSPGRLIWELLSDTNPDVQLFETLNHHSATFPKNS